MKVFLSLIVTLAVLTGCATKNSTGEFSRLLSRETKVSIFFDNREVLNAAGAELQPVSKRIETYLINNLRERGIDAKPNDAFTSGDAKLIVTLNTIEFATKTSVGWAIIGSTAGVGMSPSVSQQPSIRLTATLISPEGKKLFSSNRDANMESWDLLAKKLGNKIGDEVVGFYSKDMGKKPVRDYQSEAPPPALTVTTGHLYRLDDGSVISIDFEQNGSGHGSINGKSPAGETFKGEYTTLANASAIDRNTYSWTAEMGFPTDSQSLQYGTATAAGSKGTTIEVIYTVNPATGHGSGVGKDNKGNKYRLQF